MAAERRRPADTDDVAVGRRLGDRIDGEQAAGARTVLDDQRLAEQLFDARLHEARHRVRASTRRKTDQDADRLVRPGGRSPAGECCAQTCDECGSDGANDARHRVSTHGSCCNDLPAIIVNEGAILLLLGWKRAREQGRSIR